MAASRAAPFLVGQVIQSAQPPASVEK